MFLGPSPAPSYDHVRTGSLGLSVTYGVISGATAAGAAGLFLAPREIAQHLPHEALLVSGSLLAIIAVIAGALTISEYSGYKNRR